MPVIADKSHTWLWSAHFHRVEPTRTPCTLQCALAVTVEATDRHQERPGWAGPGAPRTIRSTLFAWANRGLPGSSPVDSRAQTESYKEARAELETVRGRMVGIGPLSRPLSEDQRMPWSPTHSFPSS